MIGRFLAAFICVLLLPASAQACGAESDCKIADRHYRIRMPAGHDGKSPVGAIVFAHGYTGNARQAMADDAFTRMARKLGVAIISAKSAYRGWSLPDAPAVATRPFIDELAYFDRVLEDAAKRFPLDRKRFVAAGFSGGGMMVWHLACHRSNQFAGFIPIAGTFWAPVPETCKSPPASIVHIHGDHDPVVPLLGRAIGPAHQGEVPRALAMYANYGHFGQPSEIDDSSQGLRCRTRRNPDGHILSFCLFAGGHEFAARHIGAAWAMLKRTGRL